MTMTHYSLTSTVSFRHDSDAYGYGHSYQSPAPYVPPVKATPVPNVMEELALTTGLLTRIWLWLSQLCSGAFMPEAGIRLASGIWDDAARPNLNVFTGTTPPNRHARRMIARRARGIMPASRYAWRGMAGPLKAGASVEELRAWAKLKCRKGRFQSVHMKYYIRAFFKRLALARRFSLGLDSAQVSGLCHAPLSPD